MRILLAISGASGVVYARRLIEVLRASGHEVLVVASDGARQVSEAEGEEMPATDFDNADLAAPPASGSYPLDAMVVCPCSSRTLGEIASGTGHSLIARAAEVMLKERRKLVLVLRETPLSLIAIRQMEAVTLAGAVVLPASPAFYHSPRSISDLVDFVCGKVLDQLGIPLTLFRRWGTPALANEGESTTGELDGDKDAILED